MATYNLRRGGIHQKFLDCRKKVQMLGGGFGNGKTAAACVKAIGLATDYPGSNGLIARETYPKLNDTIRKEFYKWVPHNQVKRWPTKDDNTLILKNGSTINFRYIQQRKQGEDGVATSNLLSATYDWAIVDQIEDPGITHKDFLDLLGRLRGSTSYKGSDPTMPMSGPRWLLLTCNPTANWVYKKIVKPWHSYLATGVVPDDLLHDPHTREPMIEIIEGATYENAHNLDADFITGLEAAYTGQMRDRFLMGEWAAYEGLVYPAFSSVTHMIKRMEMVKILEEARDHKRKLNGVQALDLGMVSPSCYLLGFTDHHGRVFIIDGFYEPTPNISRLGELIVNLQYKYLDWIDFDMPISADPAIFKRTVTDGTGKSATTVAKLLKQDWELNIVPAQNDITSGIMKVSEYLTMKPGLHYLDNQPAGPAIYFNEELDFIENEMTGYFWQSDGDGNRIDVPRDKNDHAMDAVKYLLSKLPEASKLLYKVVKPEPEWMQWQEVQ
jgi:hypothetical protein